jgi:hypothetical protein
MSYGTVVENRISLPHTDCTSELGTIRPPCHDGPYVRHNTVRLLVGSHGEPHFPLHCLPILRLLGLLGTP